MRALASDVALRLIGHIYDAALDASLWPLVIREIGQAQGGNSALLVTTLHAPDQGGFLFPYNISEDALQRWASKYVQHDVWSAAGLKKGLYVDGSVGTDADLVDFNEFLRSIWYREFLSTINIARCCTGVVFGANSAGIPPTAVVVYRALNDQPFGDHEVELHRILMPHLSRALGVMFRLRDSELRVAASLAALDRLSSGVILIGAQRTVEFANRAARGSLAEEDGLRLRQEATGKTRLVAASTGAQRGLDAALDQCLDPTVVEVPHFSQVVSVPRSSGRAAYVLNVSALPATHEFGSGAGQPRAIAFLTDPVDPVRVNRAALQRLYGLTAAEFRVVEQVCSGQTVAAVAERFRVSENTVKSQLQSIYDKTGTHRQAQLVRLVLSLSLPA
ncbi:MAG: helix-turn-helix transcriptional regulator [Betaproteobacteria bacterium]